MGRRPRFGLPAATSTDRLANSGAGLTASTPDATPVRLRRDCSPGPSAFATDCHASQPPLWIPASAGMTNGAPAPFRPTSRDFHGPPGEFGGRIDGINPRRHSGPPEADWSPGPSAFATDCHASLPPLWIPACAGMTNGAPAPFRPTSRDFHGPPGEFGGRNGGINPRRHSGPPEADWSPGPSAFATDCHASQPPPWIPESGAVVTTSSLPRSTPVRLEADWSPGPGHSRRTATSYRARVRRGASLPRPPNRPSGFPPPRE